MFVFFFFLILGIDQGRKQKTNEIQGSVLKSKMVEGCPGRGKQWERGMSGREISGDWEGGRGRERENLSSELVPCSGDEKTAGGKC